VTLAAAPAALVAFVSPNPAVYMPAIVVTELLLFASTGPINSAIVNLVAPTERATAVALSILGIHLLGDVPSRRSSVRSRTRRRSNGVPDLPVIALAGGIWLYAAETLSPRHPRKRSFVACAPQDDN
jgi:hypothetical protein